MNNKISFINNDYHIIIIQKYVRRFLIKKKILIPQSCYQTKIWRKNSSFYINGKKNECEKYQIKVIENITNDNIKKTNHRINFETKNIEENKNPLKNKNGYEFSENFDGLVIKNDKKYYYNLKFVCDSGGAQTRTLREVYCFIKYQMKFLKKMNTNNIYFYNILDGDECYKNMDKFMYLMNKEKYKQVIKYIFIGSLYDFQKNIYKYT